MVTQTLSTDSTRLDRVVPRRVERRTSTPVAPVPEDAARYVCECGAGFTAAVTTSVMCPSCGHGQAW
jgi:hypothetical protein